MPDKKKIEMSRPDSIKEMPKETFLTAKGDNSAAATLTLRPEDYSTAINYISNQTGKLNAVTNQINLLTGAAYRPGILSAIEGMQDHLSTFSNIHSILPKISQLTAVESMINLPRQATLAISGLTTPSVLTGLAASVAADYQPWYEANIVKGSILSAKMVPTLNTVEIGEKLAKIMGAQTVSALAIQSSIIKATEISLFAEKSLCTVTPQNLGSKLALEIEPKNYIKSSFLNLSDSYSTLLKSFNDNPISYTQISPSILKIAPTEYFSTANLLEAISVEEDVTPEEELLKNELQYENEISLSTHLPRIHEGLYKMWKGAIEAYNSDNSDKIRHFSASIRELYTHLFHKLAPDDAIKKWTDDPGYYHEGRPTRKARILYICRNINNGPFCAFVKKDVDAAIAFIDVFQKGTHDIDPAFSPNHLVAIKSKAESTLKFLLEIYFSTGN